MGDPILSLKLTAASIAAIALMTASPGLAQAKQTVDGAQKFLSSVLQQTGVSLSVIAIRKNPKLDFFQVDARSLSIPVVDGVAQPCMTEVGDIDFDHLSLAERQSPLPHSLALIRAVFKPPIRIDWSRMQPTAFEKAIIIYTIGKKDDPVTELVRLDFADAEMTTRVDYAMKFLRASCDATGDTGF